MSYDTEHLGYDLGYDMESTSGTSSPDSVQFYPEQNNSAYQMDGPMDGPVHGTVPPGSIGAAEDATPPPGTILGRDEQGRIRIQGEGRVITLTDAEFEATRNQNPPPADTPPPTGPQGVPDLHGAHGAMRDIGANLPSRVTGAVPGGPRAQSGPELQLRGVLTGDRDGSGGLSEAEADAHMEANFGHLQGQARDAAIERHMREPIPGTRKMPEHPENRRLSDLTATDLRRQTNYEITRRYVRWAQNNDVSPQQAYETLRDRRPPVIEIADDNTQPPDTNATWPGFPAHRWAPNEYGGDRQLANAHWLNDTMRPSPPATEEVPPPQARINPMSATTDDSGDGVAAVGGMLSAQLGTLFPNGYPPEWNNLPPGTIQGIYAQVSNDPGYPVTRPPTPPPGYQPPGSTGRIARDSQLYGSSGTPGPAATGSTGATGATGAAASANYTGPVLEQRATDMASHLPEPDGPPVRAAMETQAARMRRIGFSDAEINEYQIQQFGAQPPRTAAQLDTSFPGGAANATLSETRKDEIKEREQGNIRTGLINRTASMIRARNPNISPANAQLMAEQAFRENGVTQDQQGQQNLGEMLTHRDRVHSEFITMSVGQTESLQRRAANYERQQVYQAQDTAMGTGRGAAPQATRNFYGRQGQNTTQRRDGQRQRDLWIYEQGGGRTGGGADILNDPARLRGLRTDPNNPGQDNPNMRSSMQSFYDLRETHGQLQADFGSSRAPEMPVTTGMSQGDASAATNAHNTQLRGEARQAREFETNDSWRRYESALQEHTNALQRRTDRVAALTDQAVQRQQQKESELSNFGFQIINQGFGTLSTIATNNLQAANQWAMRGLDGLFATTQAGERMAATVLASLFPQSGMA